MRRTFLYLACFVANLLDSQVIHPLSRYPYSLALHTALTEVPENPTASQQPQKSRELSTCDLQSREGKPPPRTSTAGDPPAQPPLLHESGRSESPRDLRYTPVFGHELSTHLPERRTQSPASRSTSWWSDYSHIKRPLSVSSSMDPLTTTPERFRPFHSNRGPNRGAIQCERRFFFCYLIILTGSLNK